MSICETFAGALGLKFAARHGREARLTDSEGLKRVPWTVTVAPAGPLGRTSKSNSV